MKFSDKITKLRKFHGFTQETFSDQISVSRQSVYKWENGTSYPEVEKLLKIARLFSVTVDDLLNDEMGMDENGRLVPMTAEEEAALAAKKRRRSEKKAAAPVAPMTEEPEVVAEPVAEAAVVEEPVPVAALVEALAEEAVAEAEEVPAAEPVAEEPVADAPAADESAAVAEAEDDKNEEKRGFFSRLFRRK